MFQATQAGQQITVELYNDTTGSPAPIHASSYMTTAAIYNHTNPLLISGVCGTVLTSDIYQGNKFAIYASSQMTNGASAPLILSNATYSLKAYTTGCSGNLINITFNVTLTFNGTKLVPLNCTTVKISSDNGTIYLGSDAICQINNGSCLSFEFIGNNTLDPVFTGVCGIQSEPKDL